MDKNSLFEDTGSYDVKNELYKDILKSCHQFYKTPNGPDLIECSLLVGDKILMPPKKFISILLIGNHSSGKSSFINWYVGENVLKTGVAMETDMITVVLNGAVRSRMDAESLVKLYPQYNCLKSVNNAFKYTRAEICNSQKNNNYFPYIQFIDTPGIVDSNINYNFDIEQSIYSLANTCDLIFVFLDPIHKAFCRKTIDIIEHVYLQHEQKISFFLSKADTAGNEFDRRKICTQISQSFGSKSPLNNINFQILTIFIPELAYQDTPYLGLDYVKKYIAESASNQSLTEEFNDNKSNFTNETHREEVKNYFSGLKNSKNAINYDNYDNKIPNKLALKSKKNGCMNMINDVIKLIENTVENNVVFNIRKLENDSIYISKRIQQNIDMNNLLKIKNKILFKFRLLFKLITIILFFVGWKKMADINENVNKYTQLSVNFLLAKLPPWFNDYYQQFYQLFKQHLIYDKLLLLTDRLHYFDQFIAKTYDKHNIRYIIIALFLFITFYFPRYYQTYDRKRLNELKKYKDFVDNKVPKEADLLNKQFIQMKMGLDRSIDMN